jgi:hypothetical protein
MTPPTANNPKKIDKTPLIFPSPNLNSGLVSLNDES